MPVPAGVRRAAVPLPRSSRASAGERRRSRAPATARSRSTGARRKPRRSSPSPEPRVARPVGMRRRGRRRGSSPRASAEIDEDAGPLDVRRGQPAPGLPDVPRQADAVEARPAGNRRRGEWDEQERDEQRRRRVHGDGPSSEGHARERRGFGTPQNPRPGRGAAGPLRVPGGIGAGDCGTRECSRDVRVDLATGAAGRAGDGGRP